MTIVESVAVAYGSALTPEQRERANQLARWLRSLIERTALAQGVTVAEDDMEVVLVEAVKDALRNPDGTSTQTTVQVDDASISTRRDARDPLSLAPNWWAFLGLRAPGSGDSGAFSVSPAYAPGGYYGGRSHW